MERKQADRQIRRRTGNGPTVLKQTYRQEIDLQLGNSPIDKETDKQILTNGQVTD